MAVRDVVQAAAGVGGGAGELANAIDFDRLNDYLSSSGDLTGATNSKTMTLSAWIYPTGTSEFYIHGYAYSNNVIRLQYNSNGFNLKLSKSDSASTVILNAVSASASIPKDTWSHLLISFDLNNSALRHVYLNDNPLSMSWYSYTNSQYVESAISNVRVGDNFEGSRSFGRMAHVFKDNTYRDLTVVANRRLFITADLKPADGQADLNPILYLPLGDPEDIGYNAGTGGNLNVNGVMARSGRGPNQDNTVASYFDGSNDNLYRAGAYGADSKTLTISFCYSSKAANTQIFNSEIASGDDNIYVTPLNATGGLQIGTLLNNASNYAVVVNIPSTVVTHNSTHAISVSFDTSDTSKRHVFVDGVDKTASVSWLYYNLNSFVGFSLTSRTRLGAGWASGSNSYFWGNLGEFYLSKDYTDLASNNPFWDSDLGKPISIRKVLADTGNTPLIAMPIEATNAGLNLGTGGNFTVNSGPFIGARGGSEYWARSMGGVASYLGKDDVGIPADSATVTYVFAMKTPTGWGNDIFFSIDHTSGLTNSFYGISSSSGTIRIAGRNSAGTNIYTRDTSVLSLDTWYMCLFSCDLASGTDHFYIANVSQPVATLKTTGETFGFSSGDNAKIGGYYGGGRLDATQFVAVNYFTTDYIDFSQEANRLKFVDAFGYPIDLQPAIDAGDIPNPLVYMKFDDPLALGTNSGTGGDFTVNGTIISGPDVKY